MLSPFGLYHLRSLTSFGFGTLALHVKKRFLPTALTWGPSGLMISSFDCRRWCRLVAPNTPIKNSKKLRDLLSTTFKITRKRSKLIVAHIFMVLLTHFASKLVYYARHKESFNNFWKSSNRHFRRKMLPILHSWECSKTPCASNNRPIWTPKVPKDD